jgi:hypothetical protein
MAIKKREVKPPEPLPDLGKCAVCGDPITVRDASGNDHCRNGHVYATNFEAAGFGPVTAEEIEQLQEAAAADNAKSGDAGPG